MSRGSEPRSQREAAAAAGLSERQEPDAVRVAKVPAKEFERLVESDKRHHQQSGAVMWSGPSKPMRPAKPGGHWLAFRTRGSVGNVRGDRRARASTAP